MTEQDKCSQCGAALPSSVRGGLCPACLLKRGLETNTIGYTAGEPGGSGWKPPAVQELSAVFEELDIIELIGRGGMGAVYKAREKHLDRLVALKILPPELAHDAAFAQRFTHEAQAMARLNHANIVTIHSFGQRGEFYFFIMEYVDGLSLRQLLNVGQVSPKEALAIVPQICDALQYAHDRGIVHRDIKPENILLNRAGQVKIADFGLAKLVGGLSADSTAASEKVMGTPQYMAPEQVARPREVDHRADIYSLGVVFYQMLTGELPTGKFEPPSHRVLIDVRLDEVVLRALEKSPERRYQQASQVKTQVETIVASPASVAPSQTTSYRVRRVRVERWHRWVAVVGVRGGKPVVNWRGVLILAGVMISIWALTSAVMYWRDPRGFSILPGSMAAAAILLAIPAGIYIGFRRPVESLTPLDEPPPSTTSQPGQARRAGAGEPPGVRAELEWNDRKRDFFLPLVGVRDGRRVICWRGVILASLITAALAAFGGFLFDLVLYRLTGVSLMGWPFAAIALGGAIIVIGTGIRRAYRLPIERLTQLESRPGPVEMTPQMEQARQAVTGPAFGLMVVAAIHLGILITLIYGAITSVPPVWTHDYAFPFVAVLVLLALAGNIFVVASASRMRQLRNRRLAIDAAIVAMFPLGGPLGLIVGIWALVVLSRREVKEAFAAVAAGRESGPGHGSPPAEVHEITPAEAGQMAKARQVVTAPAIGLIVAAGINLAILLALIAMVAAPLLGNRGAEAARARAARENARLVAQQEQGQAQTEAQSRPAMRAEPAGGVSRVSLIVALPALLCLPLSLIVLLGAIRMMQLRNRGLSITAAILALIAVPGSIIGLPFGIWSLVVLSRRDVSEAFAAVATGRTTRAGPGAPPAGAGKSHALRWVVVIAVLAVIGVIVVTQWRPSTHSSSQPTALPPADPEAAKVWQAIKLYGVCPDGGDDLLDADGREIGKCMGLGWPEWSSGSQARALIFDLPQSPQLDWAMVPEIRVSGVGRPLGGSMGSWTADFQGKPRRILDLCIHRSYEEGGLFGSRTFPVDHIDVTLKYYLPARGKAVSTFLGPFEVGKTIHPQEGRDCSLKVTGTTYFDGRGTKFHLATDFDFGDDPPLVYDSDGKRYFARHASGEKSVSANRVSVQKDYEFEVPPSRLAAITIGETPQAKTFSGITVVYPDRPARQYPEYLDKMASRLGLTGLSADQFRSYQFKTADEALKVIDIVRGSHIERAWQAIQGSDFAELAPDARDKLRRTAKAWADNGAGPGIEMGLKGQWPEFVAPALEVLGRDTRERSTVAYRLQSYRQFTPEQFDQIAAVLERRDDPRGLDSLLWCLGMNRSRPGRQEALLRLARSRKAWLWWPAMGYLTAPGGPTLAQLPPDLQAKDLARTNPERGLDPTLAAEARALLAKSLRARLASMSTSTLGEVFRSAVANLPRAEAQEALLNLLADMVDHWWDYRVEGYSPDKGWIIDRAVRYLNNWNNLDLGGIGSDLTKETDQSHGIDWPTLANQALAHFGRSPATAPAERVGTGVSEETQPCAVTLVDALGQPIAGATLELQAGADQQSLISPRPLVGGPAVLALTDSKGRCKIDWPVRTGNRQIYSFFGLASHPDYGVAPVTVSGGGGVTKALLARKGTPEYERAVRGQVVNEAGRPVAGAVVESHFAVKPWMNGQGSVIAGPDGNFVMPFVPYSDEDKGLQLPSDAEYEVVARAPAGVDLFPASARGASPMRLILHAPTLNPRRLQFEVGDDQYAQGEHRGCVRLTWLATVNKPGEIDLEYRYLSDKPVRLVPGRYTARFADSRGRYFEYLPVNIDDSSPETIVFRRPPAVTFSGQVVDGVTGEPVSGAIVFTGGARGNPAMLFDQDWKDIEAMPDRPSLDDPGVKAIGRHYVVEAIMRTDAQGRYELTRGREQRASMLVALMKDRLPMPVEVYKLKPDDQQRVEIQPVPLFPVACVKLLPQTPQGQSPSVYLKFSYQPDGQPEWFGRFKKAMDRAPFPPWMDTSGPMRVFVPAGVRLKLRFGCSGESLEAQPGDEILELSAGETRDLGALKFVPAGKPATTTSRSAPAAARQPVGQAGNFTLKPLVGEIDTTWPCVDLDTGRESTLGQSSASSSGSLFATRILNMTQSLILMTDRAELREMPKGQDASALWNVSNPEAALALATQPGTFSYPARQAPYVLAYKTQSGQVGLIKVEEASPQQARIAVRLLNTRPATRSAAKPQMATTQNATRPKRLAAESDIAAISTAMTAFHIDTGRYPTTEEGLAALAEKSVSIQGWNGPYIKMSGRRVADDPWGRPYVYRCPDRNDSEGFELISIGPDGQEGTADDLTNWALLATQPATQPQAVSGSDSQVRRLEGEILELEEQVEDMINVSHVTESHPQVKLLRERIAVLKKLLENAKAAPAAQPQAVSGTDSQVRRLEGEILELERQVELETKVNFKTESHPAVKNLRERIAVLKKRLEKAQAAPATQMN